jgi:hypothetical protein
MIEIKILEKKDGKERWCIYHAIKIELNYEEVIRQIKVREPSSEMTMKFNYVKGEGSHQIVKEKEVYIEKDTIFISGFYSSIGETIK